MTNEVQLKGMTVRLSQPLADRPDVLVVETGDGRRSIIGDRHPFTAEDFERLIGGAAIHGEAHGW